MSIPISTALCLAASDFEALVQGRMIAAISRSFINSVPHFALCPIGASHNRENESIEFWASLESCRIYQNEEELEKLAKLTIWKADDLKHLVNEQYKVFLICLRVYRLAESLTVPARQLSLTRIGSFIRLPNYVLASLSEPVLSSDIFAKRKHQLENLEPPEHPEIEALHSTIAQLTPTHPNAIHLEQDLKCFLGWSESTNQLSSHDDWVQDIAKAGNSSNGDYFEKLVRKSFVTLGFTNSRNNPKMGLDPDAAGGAGGIDFFCDAPYLVIGECKASKDKKVADHKDGAPAQILKYGGSYLEPEEFADCIRIIMAPGQLTDYAKRTANGNKMNVLQPETLQRLIETKQAYPGAINLWELKSCLSKAPFSQAADDKVNQFIDRIQEDIEVRSKIVQLLQNQAPHDFGVDFIWGAYQASNPPRSLNQEQLKEILIELSSPLTGFIGRKDSDRFYFLRPFQ
jgi:hypothetical protein